jgi:hypothetical protein
MYSPTNPPDALLLPTDERRVSPSSSLPEGYKLSVLTYGSTNLLQEPLHISNGDPAELVVRFSAAPGSWTQVRGRVTGVDLSARDYFVSFGRFRISRRRVAPDGSFAFLTVLRGTRTISL